MIITLSVTILSFALLMLAFVVLGNFCVDRVRVNKMEKILDKLEASLFVSCSHCYGRVLREKAVRVDKRRSNACLDHVHPKWYCSDCAASALAISEEISGAKKSPDVTELLKKGVFNLTVNKGDALGRT